MPAFERYIGIDYSGAQTPTSSLSGLRVYQATPETPAQEVMCSATSPPKDLVERKTAEIPG